MNVELSLIRRRKLNGLGDHYGVKIGNQVIDFHNEAKLTTLDDFSKNGKYEVIEEAKAILPQDTLKERLNDLKDYKYDLPTKNCEHWARRMVEGIFYSKQTNLIAFVGIAIGIFYFINNKTR